MIFKVSATPGPESEQDKDSNDEEILNQNLEADTFLETANICSNTGEENVHTIKENNEEVNCKQESNPVDEIYNNDIYDNCQENVKNEIFSENHAKKVACSTSEQDNVTGVENNEVLTIESENTPRNNFTKFDFEKLHLI